MGRMSDWWGKSDAVVAMLVVQLISAGLQILSRVILTEGTFIFALIAYRHLLASLCIAPFAFFLERGEWKKISLLIVLWLFLSALTGTTMGMGLFYYGMKKTNATFATNFLNLIPIVTFAFSAILRMESLRLRSWRGKLKLGGAVVCVSGALIITLYKGKVLLAPHRTLSLHHTAAIVNAIKPNWTVGTLLLVGSCLSFAAWFLVQAKMLKAFPFRYWATMLQCLIASIESVAVGLCIDRSKHAWKLQWNLQLVTIIYSGVLGSAFTFYLISWTIANKGPTYVPMFSPIGLIFVATAEIIVLGGELRLGSLLGMIVIVAGIYAFLWGTSVGSRKRHILPEEAVNVEKVSTTTVHQQVSVE